MSYSITCGDVMPGCAEHFEASTEAGLIGQVAEHAQRDHGLKPGDLTPAVLDQVKGAITIR